MIRMQFVMGAALLLGAAPAFADDPAPPADPNAAAPAGGGAAPAGGSATAAGTPAATTPPKIMIGGGLELSPLGSLNVSAGGLSASADTELAYGLDITALYAVHPMVAVGLAPRYVMGIKAKDAQGDSASMIDLRAIAVVHKAVATKIEAFGFAALGYGMISIPNNPGDNPAGLDISFGAGAGYQLGGKLIGTVSAGYEIGMEKVMDADANWNHLMISLGVMYALK